MIHLMNSAMMPNEGNYNKVNVSKEDFSEYFLKWIKSEGFKSYIGYPAVASVLERILGTTIQLSRESTSLKSGDVMMVARLKERLANPGDKSKHEIGWTVEEYEFSIIHYSTVNEKE